MLHVGLCDIEGSRVFSHVTKVYHLNLLSHWVLVFFLQLKGLELFSLEEGNLMCPRPLVSYSQIEN